jgi:hypothetical protein
MLAATLQELATQRTAAVDAPTSRYQSPVLAGYSRGLGRFDGAGGALQNFYARRRLGRMRVCFHGRSVSSCSPTPWVP